MRDLPLRESLAINGRVPEFAIVLHVERVLIHCPKCVIRSKLWKPEEWPELSSTADIEDAMIAHAKLDATREQLIAFAEQQGLTRLY